jgi:Na+/H+ antiporter NhaD/arsenite permease-like protein
MSPVVLAVFIVVYLGMIVGGIPGLAIDRSGIGLLGAIALLATGRVGMTEAWQAIDVPTIALLFGLMVVSAQFRLGGVYTRITRALGESRHAPPRLLAALIGVTGLLSAVLANDVVCLAVAPVLVEACARRRLDPRPFLLALACAANIGSAATLIGNPQNMLIGQTLRLSFAGYLLQALVPSALGLGLCWAVIALQFRGSWIRETPMPSVEAPPFDRWQATKGVVVVAAVVGMFLLAPWPREIVALSAAGVLLLSRRMASRRMLGLVDWHLLVLFIGLFVVNHALAGSGPSASGADAVRTFGLDPRHPAVLFGVAAVLSNLVSNVPAVMLLLRFAEHPLAGPVLALSSTLAGNLIVVGSIANIIVIDQASRLGVRITWREHARTGIPITIATLAVAAAWLVVIG